MKKLIYISIFLFPIFLLAETSAKPLPTTSPASAMAVLTEDMSFENALDILINTKFIVSAKTKLGNNYHIDQTRALAILVQNKDKAKSIAATQKLFKDAKNIEGKIYALIALYALGEKDSYEILKAKYVESEDDFVKVFMGRGLFDALPKQIFSSLEENKYYYVLRYVPINSVSLPQN